MSKVNYKEIFIFAPVEFFLKWEKQLMKNPHILCK